MARYKNEEKSFLLPAGPFFYFTPRRKTKTTTTAICVVPRQSGALAAI
jgi:hypothetical protein